MKNLTGKHVIAQKDMDILYTIHFGGGRVKAGHVLKLIDLVSDINSFSYATDKTLYRISESTINDENFFKVL